ncbi:hypothetical protein BC832DRAFT_564060 [Gaertneriomyces semiglobifer]|nr:hypothetical protein BC832DRAFT_564060 [Gaertneriomyces semiglobifer]
MTTNVTEEMADCPTWDSYLEHLDDLHDALHATDKAIRRNTWKTTVKAITQARSAKRSFDNAIKAKNQFLTHFPVVDSRSSSCQRDQRRELALQVQDRAWQSQIKGWESQASGWVAQHTVPLTNPVGKRGRDVLLAELSGGSPSKRAARLVQSNQYGISFVASCLIGKSGCTVPSKD